MSEERIAELTKIGTKIVFGACIAFCMEVSEFLVLSLTSSLTLSVASIFKVSCEKSHFLVKN